ncbi:MAG: hypothetical protein V4663_16010 [Bacteroidota bacterium]
MVELFFESAFLQQASILATSGIDISIPDFTESKNVKKANKSTPNFIAAKV